MTVTRCDQSALNLPAENLAKLPTLLARVAEISAESDVLQIVSPLDGRDIMALLGVPPGPILKKAKDFLTNEVLEGRLAEGNQETASILLRAWFQEQERFYPQINTE